MKIAMMGERGHRRIFRGALGPRRSRRRVHRARRTPRRLAPKGADGLQRARWFQPGAGPGDRQPQRGGHRGSGGGVRENAGHRGGRPGHAADDRAGDGGDEPAERCRCRRAPRRGGGDGTRDRRGHLRIGRPRGARRDPGQVSQFRRIVLGEMDGRVTPRIGRIAEALSRMGIAVETTDNIRKVLWTKFVFIAAFSGVGDTHPDGARRFSGCPRLAGAARESDAGSVRPGASERCRAGTGRDRSDPGIDGRCCGCDEAVHAAGRGGRAAFRAGVHDRGDHPPGAGLGVPTPVADLVYAALLPAELKARRTAV